MQLDPNRLLPAPAGTPSLTPAEAEALLGCPLHESVAGFLAATAGSRAVRGGLRIHGAAAIPRQGLPLEPWSARFGDGFPALAIGSDGLGHELWVHAGSGRVISVHHDSLDEGLAGVRLPADVAAATERILSGRAALTLPEILALHAALEGTGDDPVAALHAICDALEGTVAQVVARLDAAPLAFLWVRVRALLEGDDTGGIQATRDTLAALSDPSAFARKRSLSLARGGLRTLPPAVLTLAGISRLDLSGNPALTAEALGALAALPKLKDLSLAGCRLSALPPVLAGLTTLQKLDLSDNPIADLPDLSALKKLKLLDLRGTRIDSSARVEPLRAALPGCIIHLARPLHPAGIAAAQADPQHATVIDLSIGYSDDHALVPSLPPLSQFPRLAVLRLRHQRKLKIHDVLDAADGCTLTELDLRTLSMRDATPLDLDRQPALQILRLSGEHWPSPSTAELLRYAATHDSLKSLQCQADSSWDGVMPQTALEELHLRGARMDDEPTRRIPRTISQPRLRRLHLQGHSYVLGAEWGEMPALEEVVLEGPLEGHAVLSRCTGLTALTIRESYVEDFPDLTGLSRLRELTMIDVGRGSEALPPQLSSMPALRALHLDRCRLPEHPADLWGATGLERLHLSFSSEVTLPAGLEALTRLTDLHLQDVICPPESLALPALRRLRWRCSEGDGSARLRVIADACRALTELDLSDFSITRLPPSLAGLTALTRLKLKTWRELDMSAQPDVFGAMCGVTDLELSGMTMRRLPEGVLAMPLVELTLDNAESMDWPAVFTQLAGIPTLRRLQIRWGRLAAVPAEIAGLVGLTELVVHQSGTRSVHPDIAALTRLQRLQVTAARWPAADRKRIKKKLPACQVVSW